MGLEPHQNFEPPERDVSLWRYTDLAKLLSLLTEKALWFGNVESAAADDPYEGHVPSQNFSYSAWTEIAEVPIDLLRTYQRLEGSRDPSNIYDLVKLKEFFHKWTDSITLDRRTFFINCWHQSNYDSMAMWKMYGSRDGGVAIRSTVQNIEKAVSEIDFPIFIGKVQYVGEAESSVETSLNVFASATVKRKPFEFEREVRLLCWNQFPIWTTPGIVHSDRYLPDHMRDARGEPTSVGLLMSCKIEELIEEIVISPLAPDFYLKTIRRTLESLGIDVPLRVSSLMDLPSRS